MGIKQTNSKSTINTIVRVLKSELLKNPLLVNDLLTFLKHKGIKTPTNEDDIEKVCDPINYNTKESENKIQKLKNSFEGIDSIENIL